MERVLAEGNMVTPNQPQRVTNMSVTLLGTMECYMGHLPGCCRTPAWAHLSMQPETMLWMVR